MLNIEENMSQQEQNVMSRWHTYSGLGGSADFEVFYAHSKDNQKLLVKAARGKALNTLSLSEFRGEQC
jgi:hypothetical protein